MSDLNDIESGGQVVVVERMLLDADDAARE